jgi:hypothetical protein
MRIKFIGNKKVKVCNRKNEAKKNTVCERTDNDQEEEGWGKKIEDEKMSWRIEGEEEEKKKKEE